MAFVNFLISKDGKCYDVTGVQHNIYVRYYFRVSLKKFLQDGGVRVKTHNDHMAVEAGRSLTVEQKMWVREALREYDYYSVVVSIGGKYAVKKRFRPIRSI